MSVLRHRSQCATCMYNSSMQRNRYDNAMLTTTDYIHCYCTQQGKAKSKQSDTIVLALETIESFAMLALEAPGSKTAVPDAIEALKAKKQWYSEQPRGTVPKVSHRAAVAVASVTQSERCESCAPVRHTALATMTVSIARSLKRFEPLRLLFCLAATRCNSMASYTHALPLLLLTVTMTYC
jgi:hypothetical protein